jgi:NADH-quinone oxidoreductase subunit H
VYLLTIEIFIVEILNYACLPLFTLNYNVVITILTILIKIICILISVAYFTIAERKIMASIQRRLGPNVEGGPFGILQPLADGLKLFIKELIIPGRANILIYFLAPILIFTLSLVGWSVIPFYYNYQLTSFYPLNDISETIFDLCKVADSNYGILFLLAISSLNVYGIILGGWASNSKYAFLGALRSAAQMISYEVSISLTILPVILLTGSFNFFDIMHIQTLTCWFFLPLLPSAIIFFISMLAETNRAPFDLPEAEAELVAGYNVEYSSMAFALFFLGEYPSMLLMASFSIILFYGGFFTQLIKINYLFIYLSPFIFALKIIFFGFMYILVRATFPRYRYDQLMTIGWKILLPLMLSFFILNIGLIILFDCGSMLT